MNENTVYKVSLNIGNKIISALALQMFLSRKTRKQSVYAILAMLYIYYYIIYYYIYRELK